MTHLALRFRNKGKVASFRKIYFIIVETGPKKTGKGQKLTTNKKSTIFELSSWNLDKMTNPWGSHFDQVSWW